MGKFLVGLIFGVAIAIGIVYYLNNNQAKFMNKVGIIGESSNESVAPTILVPSTKIKEVASSPSGDYDFYQILQNSDASSTVANNTGNGQKSKNSQVKLQIGVFSDIGAAKDMKGRLAFLGYEAKILSVQGDDGMKNKVIVGPYNSESEANAVKKDLDNNGIKSVLVR